MKISTRIERYKAIEEVRKRPLIVYATTTRPGVNAMIGADAVREFVDQADAIPAGSDVDILIHSFGGDPLAAWKIMSILRERFAKIDVLVPCAAFSAATIFALGADQIFMHPHASLGPIDPQIGSKQPDGSVKFFAYEDLGGFLRFLHEDVKLTEQTHLSSLADKLFGSVDPLLVGAAKRASALTAEVGARLLSTHMDDDRKAKQIALNLNKAFFAHGDAVSRTRATELGLNVAPKDETLEKLIWDAYLGLEGYLQIRSPFNPLVEYYANPQGAAALRPPPRLNLPSDTPPEAANQVWTAVLNQAMTNATAAAPEIESTIIFAVVESVRCASQQRSVRRISAARQAGGDIKVWMTDVVSGWETVATADTPEAPAPTTTVMMPSFTMPSLGDLASLGATPMGTVPPGELPETVPPANSGATDDVKTEE